MKKAIKNLFIILTSTLVTLSMTSCNKKAPTPSESTVSESKESESNESTESKPDESTEPKSEESTESSHSDGTSEVHDHTYDGYEHDETSHWQVCSICGESTAKENHRGGTSTCTQKAICDVCGAEYGELDEHQYGEWEFVDGEENHFKECSVCHDKVYEQHSFVLEVVSEDALKGELDTSCDGSNTYYKSCVCGAHSHNEEDTFVVDNHHEYTVEEVLEGDVNLISPATCEEAAVYGKVCEHCHTAFSTELTFESGDPKGHTLEHFEELLSFSQYHSEYYHCKECDKYFADADGTIEKDIDEIFDDTKAQYGDDEYGTEEKPYLIADKADLSAMRSEINGSKDTFEGKYISLVADLDYEEEEFTSVIGVGTKNNCFKGTFDGQNHIISGLSLTREAGCLALFGNAIGATIKNLKLDNIDFYANSETANTAQRVAGFVGRAENVTIENCHVLGGSINGSKQNGGIVGVLINGGVIRNCSNAASVSTSDIGSGGIVGVILRTGDLGGEAIIENCTNYGVITAGTKGVGGILGIVMRNSDKDQVGVTNVVGCKNEGAINAGNSDGAAGIVGWHNEPAGVLNVSYCSNAGRVYRAAGGYGTAGILGININNAVVHISKCKNTGDISALGAQYVGGIIGLGRVPNDNTITDCYNSGNVEGSQKANVGFIAGCNRNTISNVEVDKSAVAKSSDGLEITAGEAIDPKATGNASYNYVYGAQDNNGKTVVESTRTITPIEVSFTINYATEFGYSVYLIGSFNRWSDESEKADNRYQLTWNEGNDWTGTFVFAEGDTIEFKAVIAGSGFDQAITTWESGSNRTLVISSEMERNQVLNWQA
ncbi:MAG: hypothetical protein IJQ67_04330 [Bacilli bacterium]|nr:hypothetical protein [Bacilli bacterium]